MIVAIVVVVMVVLTLATVIVVAVVMALVLMVVVVMALVLVVMIVMVRATVPAGCFVWHWTYLTALQRESSVFDLQSRLSPV